MSVANDNRIKPCAICGKPSAEAYRPFCSKRCADVDLARWLGGTYAIPAAPAFDEGDEEDGRAPSPHAPHEDE